MWVHQRPLNKTAASLTGAACPYWMASVPVAASASGDTRGPFLKGSAAAGDGRRRVCLGTPSKEPLTRGARVLRVTPVLGREKPISLSGGGTTRGVGREFPSLDLAIESGVH